MNGEQPLYQFEEPQLRPVDQVEDLYDWINGEVLARTIAAGEEPDLDLAFVQLSLVLATLGWVLQLKHNGDCLREVLQPLAVYLDKNNVPIVRLNE